MNILSTNYLSLKEDEEEEDITMTLLKQQDKIAKEENTYITSELKTRDNEKEGEEKK